MRPDAADHDPSHVPDDAVLDLEGDLGEGRVIDTYVNRHDDPLGVTMHVCAFGEGDDLIHADREESGITRDKDRILAARTSGTSPAP